MKMKQILAILLAVFVVSSLVYTVIDEQKKGHNQSKTSDHPVRISEEQQVTTDKPQLSEQQKQNSQLTVYYFHGNIRCPTCHKLETYAKEAMDTYFADEIASNEIVWKIVNLDKPGNRHFIEDYKLVTKSVVLSQVIEDKEIKWKNLDQVWQKVRNRESYLQYVRDSIQNFRKDTNL